jgi:hypothetical protein
MRASRSSKSSPPPPAATALPPGSFSKAGLSLQDARHQARGDDGRALPRPPLRSGGRARVSPLQRLTHHRARPPQDPPVLQIVAVTPGGSADQARHAPQAPWAPLCAREACHGCDGCWCGRSGRLACCVAGT